MSLVLCKKILGYLINSKLLIQFVRKDIQMNQEEIKIFYIDL